MIKIELNVTLPSPNYKMHYFKLYKINKKITTSIKWLLKLEEYRRPTLPVNVKMIRHSKRQFDPDNYITACKNIKDTIADFIIPGKAPGQADSSKDIYWHYHQEKLQKGEKERLVIEIFN